MKTSADEVNETREASFQAITRREAKTQSELKSITANGYVIFLKIYLFIFLLERFT